MADLLIHYPKGWKENKRTGELQSTSLNVGELVNQLEQHCGDRLRYNLLSLRPEYDCEQLDQNILSNFHIILSERGWKVTKQDAYDGLIYYAGKNGFDPASDYLNALGISDSIYPSDVNQLASDYLETQDPLYNAMLKAWAIGAVSRAFNRGCKFDNMLVLKGSQGIGKSTWFKSLLPNSDWFCDTFTPDRKELYMALQTCWIYEHAELENLTTKKAVGEVKGLLTSSIDTFKPPYGRNVIKAPRPSVMVGTVNTDHFLADATGSRRFWVIHLPQDTDRRIDVERIVKDRDAFWKAALLAYRSGEKPYLSREDQTESDYRNGNYEIENMFMDPISDWVRRTNPNWFTTNDALIGSQLRELETLKKADQKPVCEVLKKLGFIQTQKHINGIKKRWWHKSVPAVQVNNTKPVTLKN